jgi:hypothetical protein
MTSHFVFVFAAIAVSIPLANAPAWGGGGNSAAAHYAKTLPPGQRGEVVSQEAQGTPVVPTATPPPTHTATIPPTETPTNTATPTSTATQDPNCSGRPDGTTCDAGDDAHGVLTCVGGVCSACVPNSAATPRFVDNGNGTITDRKTCLVWEKKDKSNSIHDYQYTFTLSAQCSSCTDPCLLDGTAFTVFLAALNTDGFAGHHDWRLPKSAGIEGGQAFGSCPTMESSEIESLLDVSGSGCTESSFIPCIDAAFRANCSLEPCGEENEPPCGSPDCTIDGAGGTEQCSCTANWAYWAGSLAPTTNLCPYCAPAFAENFNAQQATLTGPNSVTTDFHVRAVRGTICVPTTCAAQNATCGTISDGCGGTLNCGTCADPQVCGSYVVPEKQCCTPTDSCASHPAECGVISDGCGHTINCGSCTLPETCGGGGQFNQCGCTDSSNPCSGQVCGTAFGRCGEVFCGGCPSTHPKCCIDTCVCSTCLCP